MKKALLLLLGAALGLGAYSQGCVAIRSTGGLCTMPQRDTSRWQISFNNRYFKSFRHFSGREEQKHRVENNTEVINYAYAADLSVVRFLDRRWSLLVNLPVIANGRSSLYEHGGGQRHSTHSFGVGDLRAAVLHWILDPLAHPRVNVQVGAGLKFATGDYDYVDYFGPDSARSLSPVDQSIQPGDGGTGLTVELNAFYRMNPNWDAYANGFYLLNPREVNGTRNYHSATPSPNSILIGSHVMSVPDQYSARAGVNYRRGRVSLGAGARLDGVPVYDLIGKSGGFRRPGYIISAEPSASILLGKVLLSANVPVALVRNRTQSVPDKINSANSGTYRIGDAAFADYVVNVGVSRRF